MTHTKDLLAGELDKLSLYVMANKAREGYYHDFLSPLATPTVQLVADLEEVAVAMPNGPHRDSILALSKRVMEGEFDASKEESDEWANSPAGLEAIAQLIGGGKSGQTKGKKHQVGRLAMRQKDIWWVAYFALPDTMEGAVEIARVAMHGVRNRERKDRFFALCWDIVADILEERTGQRPTSRGTSPAPQHERESHGQEKKVQQEGNEGHRSQDASDEG